MKLWIVIVCTWALAPTLAVAEPKTSEPKTAEEWHDYGEEQYTLRNFDKAIEAFKKGFVLETNPTKKAAYLFNLAQVYRKTKDCVSAQFFYKRFRALRSAPNARPLTETERKTVETRIKELEQCARDQEKRADSPEPKDPEPKDLGLKDPDTKERDPKDPKGPKDPETEDPEARDPKNPKDPKTKSPEGPAKPAAHKIFMRAMGGAIKLSAGNNEIPIQPAGLLNVGVKLVRKGGFKLELGPQLTFSALPFATLDGRRESAFLFGVLANIGVSHTLTSRLALRGDLGAGLLVLSGAGSSPFTAYAETTGALSMLHVRIGLSVEAALSRHWIVTLQPIALAYSPAKTGLAPDIAAFQALDVMLGVGYRR